MVPEELQHNFGCVLADPPFVTEEVLKSYTVTAKKLLKKGKLSSFQLKINKPFDGKTDGKMILSSIAENASILSELLALNPCHFKPHIPNLVINVIVNE